MTAVSAHCQAAWYQRFSVDRLQAAADFVLAAAKAEAMDVECSLHLERGFTLDVRQQDVETLEHHRGLGLHLTAYQAGKTIQVSSSDLSHAALQQLVQKAKHLLRYCEADPCAGLAAPELLAFDYPDLELYHPWQVEPAVLIEPAIACEALALSQDKALVQSEGVSVTTVDSLYFYANSHGFTGCYPASDHSMSCSLLADAGQGKQRDLEYTRARQADQLVSWDELATQAAEKTLLRLKAPKSIPTGSYPVIFHRDVAKSLWRHLLSAISGSNLYRQSSFLCEALGQAVFRDTVTIKQAPHLLGAMGSCPFDSDGVRTKPLSYVEAGVLQSYVLSHYSAKRLGLVTTGNANGVHNLQLDIPTVPYQDLLKEMGSGLLITELMGQGVNVVTGDYSRGAFGYWVEAGEIVHAVEGITVAGNLREMFKAIHLMADDLDQRGNIATGSLLLESMTIAGQ